MDQRPQAKAPANKSMMWIVLVVVVAIVLVGAWYMMTKDKVSTNTNQQVNTATETPYSNETLGFQLTLPATWTIDSTGFDADVVFQSPKAKDCGCAVYIKKEDNASGLTAEAWLNANASSKDEYISQAEYDQRRSSGTPSEQALAGTYKEVSGQLGGQTALMQEYQAEGGGYVRYLVSRDGSVYALTLWSDGYYFTNTTKQAQIDSGQLKGEVDSLVSSFKFIP